MENSQLELPGIKGVFEKDQRMIKGIIVKIVPNHGHERDDDAETPNVGGRLIEEIPKGQYGEK
jgi:hypothetical protein